MPKRNMNAVTGTNFLLIIVIAVCSAASLTDEDIAKIFDDTAQEDRVANIGEYGNDLHLGNLRDKLRTLQSLSVENSDLFPVQDPSMLGDAQTTMDVLKHANKNAYTTGEDRFYLGATYPYDINRDTPTKRWYEKNAFPFLSRRGLERQQKLYPSELIEHAEVPKPYRMLSRFLFEKLPQYDLQQDLEQPHVIPTIRYTPFYLLQPDDISLEKRFYFFDPTNRDLEQRLANNQGFYSPTSKLSNIRDLIYSATTPPGYLNIDLVSKRKKRALRNPFGKARATTQDERRTLFFTEAGRLAVTRPSSNIDNLTGTSSRKGLRSVFQRNNICVISNDCAWT